MKLGRNRAPVQAANWVGQPITLPRDEEITTELKGPSGNLELDEESDLFYAEEPGIYTLSGPREATFAVNLPPAESKTTPLPEERLDGLKLPLAPESAEEGILAQARLQTTLDAELEKQQKWWRWFILGAIVLAILETWLGGRTWRRPALASETEEAA